tara:strand:- start:205 stop:480 length:276 start_codon:yes stop_codon:yes gene_type:complete
MDERYQLNPEVMFTYLDDEAVLMKPHSHELYGLSPVGAELWKLLEQQALSQEALTKALFNVFAVDKQTLYRDVTAFLEQLLNLTFIFKKLN